jgi:hypothetical protein
MAAMRSKQQADPQWEQGGVITAGQPVWTDASTSPLLRDSRNIAIDAPDGGCTGARTAMTVAVWKGRAV